MDSKATEYAGLLKKQRELLQKAKQFKGQKPPLSLRPSRMQLSFEFMMAAGTRDIMKLQSRNAAFIRSSFIGEAYPPCVLPLADLVPIGLRDLVLETVHRGRVLVVRTFCEPTRMTAVQNAVEDQVSDVDRLNIYNFPPDADATDVLPRGVVFAVKEPYYKRAADGGVVVRVDHPSDLVVLKLGSSLIPAALESSSAASSRKMLPPSAASLKESGNTAFKNKDWLLADSLYSDALNAVNAVNAVDSADSAEASGNNDLRAALYRNRAAARLRLGRHEMALADALAGMVPAAEKTDYPDTAAATGAATDANTKALYRAGRAAYEMGEFSQAEKHFEAAVALDDQLGEAAAELKRTRKRLEEQETGAYDFAAMHKAATHRHPRLDHASFLKNTRVGPTGSRGQGLFAAKDLKAGDVVFVEKGCHVTHAADDGADITMLLNINTNRGSSGADATALCTLVNRLLWSPALADKYFDLYDGGTAPGSSAAATEKTQAKAHFVDGKVPVDTFRAQAIAELNAFECPRVKTGDGSAAERARSGSNGMTENDLKTSVGIWLHASRANHACIPIINRAFIGDMMIVRAARDIRAGDELFMSYESPITPLAKHQQKMRTSYGFDCACALCQADQQAAAGPGAALAKRERLTSKISTLLEAHPITASGMRGVSLATRSEAKRLLEDVRDTYRPAHLYANLARPACIGIGLWTVASGSQHIGHKGGQESIAADLARAISVLRDAGFFVEVDKGGKVTVERLHAINMESSVHTAAYASQALKAMGNRGAASAMLNLARNIYTIDHGTDKGFKAEYC
ncbi:hypothetical protein SCUCBS95973_004462 [Sporothrix curviconia]|uniref:SET domain-containing protein n=1 Tax=Sporothrix curviconia TaxID=1260050 RepID=A0ABP0BP84_9PEZI